MPSDKAQMILVGASGWKHPQWNSCYYPEDLPIDGPDDWRLSYYSNDFNTVMVPSHDWIDESPATLQSWIDDVGDGFRFYVELAASGLIRMVSDQNFRATILSRLEVLATRLAGIYFKNDPPVDLCHDCRSVLEQLAARFPLYAEQPLPCTRASRVWRCNASENAGEMTRETDTPADGQMILLDAGLAGGDSDDLRAIRKCLEPFLDQPKIVARGPLAVIVDRVEANLIDAGQVLQLRKLVEMMD